MSASRRSTLDGGERARLRPLRPAAARVPVASRARRPVRGARDDRRRSRGLIDAGRVKLYCVDSYDSGSWHDETCRSRSGRGATAPTRTGSSNRVVPWIHDDCGGRGDIDRHRLQLRRLPRGQLRLKRADLFPLAICQSGVYDVSVVGWGDRGDAVYFNNPMDYVAHLDGDHLDWLRVARQPAARLRAGAVGGHDRRAREHEAVRAACSGARAPPRARPLGPRRPARLAVVARPARPPPAAVLLSGQAPHRPAARHRGGLADARSRRSSARLGPINYGGETHELATERITNEPSTCAPSRATRS